MRLLLVETTPGIAHPIEDRLVGDGHEVVSCHDATGGPCKGVADHADCPVHAHVDLAILARPDHADHTLHEMGAVCAAQHRIPVVEVDPGAPSALLDELEAAAAVARRRIEAEYAAAVRRELHLAGVDPDVRIEVMRTPQRVAAVLHLPPTYLSPTQQAALSDRARHAIRLHDPFVRVIDVSVTLDG